MINYVIISRTNLIILILVSVCMIENDLIIFSTKTLSDRYLKKDLKVSLNYKYIALLIRLRTPTCGTSE